MNTYIPSIALQTSGLSRPYIQDGNNYIYLQYTHITNNDVFIWWIFISTRSWSVITFNSELVVTCNTQLSMDIRGLMTCTPDHQQAWYGTQNELKKKIQPSDFVWSASFQVMACCQMAPSHNLTSGASHLYDENPHIWIDRPFFFIYTWPRPLFSTKLHDMILSALHDLRVEKWWKMQVYFHVF